FGGGGPRIRRHPRANSPDRGEGSREDQAAREGGAFEELLTKPRFTGSVNRKDRLEAVFFKLLPKRSYSTLSSCTWKIRVALGGMMSPAPDAPYPSSGEMTSLRMPPTFIPSKPRSQPSMTMPVPRLNWNGWPRSTELS